MMSFPCEKAESARRRCFCRFCSQLPSARLRRMRRDECETTEYVNLRSGPGTNYDSKGVLAEGTSITVTDTSNSEWYAVKTSAGTGYIFSQYIALGGSGSSAKTTEYVNLRSGPGTSYSSKGVIASGTAITVTDTSNSGMVCRAAFKRHDGLHVFGIHKDERQQLFVLGIGIRALDGIHCGGNDGVRQCAQRPGHKLQLEGCYRLGHIADGYGPQQLGVVRGEALERHDGLHLLQIHQDHILWFVVLRRLRIRALDGIHCGEKRRNTSMCAAARVRITVRKALSPGYIADGYGPQQFGVVRGEALERHDGLHLLQVYFDQFFLGSSGSATESTAAKTTEYVNVRSGPGTNYSSKGVIASGTSLTVTDRSNSEWYAVKLSNGTTGYIYSIYLKITSEGGSSEKPADGSVSGQNDRRREPAPRCRHQLRRDHGARYRHNRDGHRGDERAVV